MKKKVQSDVWTRAQVLEGKISGIPISRLVTETGQSRSWYYYKPINCLEKEEIEQRNMTLIRSVYNRHPYFGYRKISIALYNKYGITQKMSRRLMDKMGLCAIYPKPKTSTPNIAHTKFRYLLKDKKILAPNHVWEADITYIKIKGVFVYLVAILDVYSRKILSWRLSNTMETNFCLDALDEALRTYGIPAIFNTDQGSQFTSNKFVEVLQKNKIQISMDGKGRALDNIYIERSWRSLKYEEIYLNSYSDMKELKEGIDRYYQFYNMERFHQSLDYSTPDEIYYGAFRVRQSA